ncbi:MAG: hypothetical protein [Inoviridae sp.]|nr:MAG: hypothetical protein [Inoviridae sp.]
MAAVTSVIVSPMRRTPYLFKIKLATARRHHAATANPKSIAPTCRPTPLSTENIDDASTQLKHCNETSSYSLQKNIIWTQPKKI